MPVVTAELKLLDCILQMINFYPEIPYLYFFFTLSVDCTHKKEDICTRDILKAQFCALIMLRHEKTRVVCFENGTSHSYVCNGGLSA